MHYHVPKPFYRKSRKTWYVQISGRQVSLGQDRTEAFRRYYEIMANPPEKRLESVDRGTEAKGKKAPRVVYMSEVATEIVRRLIADRTQGYVFRNSKGRKWTPSAVNCAFSRIRERIGKMEMKRQGIELAESEIDIELSKLKPTQKIFGKEVPKSKSELQCEAKRKAKKRLTKSFAPPYSLYALRHSWSTNALQNDVDSLTVAILMGHQDPSMLAKVYQHLGHNPEHMLKEARKAVGEKPSSERK